MDSPSGSWEESITQWVPRFRFAESLARWSAWCRMGAQSPWAASCGRRFLRDLDRSLLPNRSALTRGNRGLQVIGWLAPNVTIDQARAEFEALEAELVREYPRDDKGLTTKIVSIRDVYVGFARPTLLAMIVATILVLLVACANVAGIQLARATSRVREIAVRSAIGANRARVFRQLLTESVMLALAGGLLGIALAYRSSEFAEVSVLGQSPRWLTPSVDWAVLAFAVAISMLTGIVSASPLRCDYARRSGGCPARRAECARPEPWTASPGFCRDSACAFDRSRRRSGAVDRKRAPVQERPLGFDDRGALMFTAALQTPQYDVAGEKARFVDALDGRAAALPGVSAAGATSLGPLHCCSQWALKVDGHPMPEDQKFMVNGNSVTPHYFEAMGIGLVKGRGFTPDDGENAPPVMVINEAFASRFWPDGDAMGHLVQDGSDHATIVGVVRDVAQSIAESPGPQFYRPYAQKPIVTPTFVVRAASGDPSRFTADLRRIVHDLDPMLPIYNITTARQTVDFNLAGRRSFEWLMIAFGVIALLLATMGVYAVTSFFVSQRRQELGLRVALGADPARLLALVLGQARGWRLPARWSGSAARSSRLGGCRTHCTESAPAIRPSTSPPRGFSRRTLVASIGPANRARAPTR